MISIIIPTYNNIRHLKECLNSVLAQTYKDLEIIIVDDGSDEASSEEIKNIAGDFFVIRISHSGAAAARNYGFWESCGDFIFFCDADVRLREDCLELMLQALMEQPEATYSYSDYNLGCKKMPGRPFDGEILKKINYISTMSLIRRARFPRFDESLKRFQDWDLWLTLLEQGKIGAYIPESLFCAHPAKLGMSKWRPAFFYKFFPWAKSTREYNKAREVVLRKHHLI